MLSKNAALAYKTLDHIKAHPEEWDQTMWHCKTTHCFGGLVEIFVTGEDMDRESTWDVAAEALGITVVEAAMLFDSENTLMDLEKIIKRIFGSRPEPVAISWRHRKQAKRPLYCREC